MATVVFNSINYISTNGVTVDCSITLDGSEGVPLRVDLSLVRDADNSEVVPVLTKWNELSPEPSHVNQNSDLQYDYSTGAINFNYRHRGPIEPGEVYKFEVKVFNPTGTDPNQDIPHYSNTFSLPDFYIPELTNLSSYRWSKNPIFQEYTGKAGIVEYVNHSVIAELFIETKYKEETFERVADQELTLDIDDKVIFYFEELISDYLKPELPPANLNTIVRASNIIKRAQVIISERSGSPIEYYTGETFYFNAILGGIQKQDHAGLDYFNTYLPTKKKFLTQQPVSKKVLKDQPEYLFFLLYKSSPKLELWAEVHFENDSKTKYKLKTYANPELGDIYIMPAGFNQLNIAGLAPTKVPVCYQLYLANDNEELSERRQYIVEEDYEPFTRYILFHTSVGGFDTLRASGKASITMAMENETLQKLMPHNHSVEDGEVHVSYVSYYDEYDFSTGFLPTKGYRDYLRDILISKARFLIEDDKRIPIVIDTRSVKIKEDDEYQPFLRFKFRKTYNDQVVTSILNDSLQDCPVQSREKAWRVRASSQYCIKS